MEKNKVHVITEEQFISTLITKGVDYTYPLVTKLNISTMEEIMKFSLITLYFVYDEFENYLDAALVLERIISSSETNLVFQHSNFFLRACMTSDGAGDKSCTDMDLSCLTFKPCRQGSGQKTDSSGIFQH